MKTFSENGCSLLSTRWSKTYPMPRTVLETIEIAIKSKIRWLKGRGVGKSKNGGQRPDDTLHGALEDGLSSIDGIRSTRKMRNLSLLGWNLGNVKNEYGSAPRTDKWVLCISDCLGGIWSQQYWIQAFSIRWGRKKSARWLEHCTRTPSNPFCTLFLSGNDGTQSEKLKWRRSVHIRFSAAIGGKNTVVKRLCMLTNISAVIIVLLCQSRVMQNHDWIERTRGHLQPVGSRNAVSIHTDYCHTNVEKYQCFGENYSSVESIECHWHELCKTPTLDVSIETLKYVKVHFLCCIVQHLR